MKFTINLSLFLFALFILSAESFSLTNYQIRKICKNDKKESICIKNFQERKTNLQKGYLIEIPVIPYKE